MLSPQLLFTKLSSKVQPACAHLFTKLSSVASAQSRPSGPPGLALWASLLRVARLRERKKHNSANLITNQIAASSQLYKQWLSRQQVGVAGRAATLHNSAF